jgi:hypothetical protein
MPFYLGLHTLLLRVAEQEKGPSASCIRLREDGKPRVCFTRAIAPNCELILAQVA